MAKKQKRSEPVAGSPAARLSELSRSHGVDLVALLERGAAGDTAAAEEAVAFMRSHPEMVDLVLSGSSTAITHWVQYASGNPFTEFVLQERARRLRKELRGESPTPLERLLVEQVVICGLQLEIAEGQYQRVMKVGETLEKTAFHDRLVDRAHRRYLASMKTLAQVRRLQLPNVAQLNVGVNQVNMAESASALPAALRGDEVREALPDHGAVTVDDVLDNRDVERIIREHG